MSAQPIAASADSCLTALEELLSNHVITENEKIEQQLVRFNVWAANIGVFAPSRASLDTRLSSRGGIKYRPLILQLLNVLEKNLQTAAGASEAAQDGDTDAGEISYPDSLQAVQDLIDRLHRLSALIRKSAVRDRNSKADNFVERDEDGNDLSIPFESNAIRIIRQRYPDASEILCRRLGKSVSLRRKRVLYNRRHQVKLAKKVPIPDQAIVGPENPYVPLPPLIVDKSTLEEISGATEPLPEEPVIAKSVRPSETAASVPDSDVQSTIAPSRASSASTGSMLQDQKLKYPRAPKIDFLMNKASCPYCSAVLTEEESSNPKSWRRHIKRDIEPYICIADSCKFHNICFNNFKQWVIHMQQEHRIQWHCSLPVHPPISFDAKEQFEQHMLMDHKGKFNPSRLSTLTKIASRPALRPFDECPLCKATSEGIDPIKGFASETSGFDRLPRHVAGHLKSLALMFLPPEDDEIGNETGSEASSSNKRSSRTVNLKESIFESSRSVDSKDSFSANPLSFDDEDRRLDSMALGDEWVPADYVEGEDEWLFWKRSKPDYYPEQAKDKVLQKFIEIQRGRIPSLTYSSAGDHERTRGILLSELEGDIRQILQISSVAQCSVYIEKVGTVRKNKQHWTVFNNVTDASSNDTENEDTTIYGIGSLTGQLIILLLSIIVDKLSYSEQQEYANYRAIRRDWHDPWDVEFTHLFNFFSDETKISTLPRHPTLRHVALHYNSFPPMNHILLAVDGTSIMSKQLFLAIAPRLARIAYKDTTKDYSEHSNSNYIMIGYLIEAISKGNLAELIQRHLFKPLGMINTYMEAPDYSTSRIAQPYSLSADGTLNRVDPWLYRADSVVSSAFGAYSCTRDLAILFRAIQAGINGAESIFTKELVTNLLQPAITNPDNADAVSLFGICTTLDTSTPGSNSFNRLIAPQDECSNYRLGYKGGAKEVKAYYLAGATTGYACSAYLLPKWKVFVIVLTNTTAFTDASDHISRLILQKTFDLSFASTSKLALLGRIFGKRNDTSSRASGSTKNVVDIVAMSSLAAVAGKKFLHTLATEDSKENTPNPRPIRLEGEYYNEQTGQSIVITQNQAQVVGTTTGASSIPQPMGVIRTGDWTIRLCPLSDSGYTINRYDSYGWRNLNFELRTGKKKFKDDDQVMYLTRQGALFLDEFKRII